MKNNITFDYGPAKYIPAMRLNGSYTIYSDGSYLFECSFLNLRTENNEIVGDCCFQEIPSLKLHLNKRKFTMRLPYGLSSSPLSENATNKLVSDLKKEIVSGMVGKFNDISGCRILPASISSNSGVQ